MAKHPHPATTGYINGRKVFPALRDQPSDIAITAKQLRDELFEAVTAATGGDDIRCHTIKEFKYGEIVSTSSVTGLKVVTDDRGQKHIIILTN